MSAANATPFPVYGQGYRLPVVFRDTSGNLITGWTGVSAYGYPDNGTGVSLTIAEAPAGSGYGYVDIPAAQMQCSMCGVVATCSNANMTAFVASVYPLVLGQFTGRWDAQSILRFEQMVQDLFIGVGLNGVAIAGAAETFLNPDGSTHFSTVIAQGETTATRSKTV
jgi:hypothetical protein